MARKKSLIRSEGSVIGTALIILLFAILVITIVRKTYWSSYWNTIASGYQSEVNKIVTPDFTLVSSKIESKGIDVGTVLTDVYTTRLPYGQAITVMETNARTIGTPYLTDCFGGFESTGKPGRLQVCETKYEKGVTTFEVSLYNFDKDAEQKKIIMKCVGDCKE